MRAETVDRELTAFERVIEEVDDLETMPAVAHRLLAITEDVDCSFDEVRRVAQTDPALVARLMRLANSACYRYQANDLRTALVVVGLAKVRDLVVASALMARRPRRDTFHRQFWEHSLRCATMSEHLAGELRSGPVTHPFLCGLLHDFGTLVLARIRGARYQQIAGTPGDPEQSERERAAYGFDHADLGATVASSWGLAPEYGWAMQFHHNPFDLAATAPDPDIARAVYVVALAYRMVAEPEQSKAQLDLLDLLGLDPDTAARVRPSAEAGYAAFTRAVGL